MKILQEAETIISNYDKTIDLVSGLKFNQKEQINTIEFYNNSKYLNGMKDELGRDKPFFQILNAICDVENSAKDLDTKDINITSDDPKHYLESWLLSKDIYNWMKEVNFAKTLNDTRDMHTRYGSVLAKKVMKDGKLTIELPEWKNTITDQVDIIKGAIIETHWMTAMDISKMTEWDKDEVRKILKKMENSVQRIPIYEIRGEFPQSYIKELNKKKITDKDEIDFSYQLYYIAGEPSESGGEHLFTATTPLYWEDDTERVYKYLARKPKAGRDFGVGVMEEGEEAQVWTNDAVLKQHRAMEYTTKVIAQSASKRLKGRNLLNETDDGTILEHEEGKPITAINLLPSGGLQQYNNLITQWYSQLEKTTSAYAAQRGETPPSGTPFRLQATLLNQSSNVFQTLQQELGIFITEIVEDWVMPYLAGKLSKQHILAYEFSPEELKDIDKKYSIKQANEQLVQAFLDGKDLNQEDYDAWMQNADEFIKQTKGKRFIDILKDSYKNIQAKVTVNTTGEQKNKAATLESLNNLLITLLNPAMANNPLAELIVSKIAELSGAGLSPVQISAAINEQNKNLEQQLAQQPQPQQAPQQKDLSLEATGATV
ncbi:MAG TPA: hypothetical protein ENG81_01565 [Candidatus Bathyarchaeota archaeon]|nr:hypothetical protein [Candidatus Bathyarchaeota archaeon]